MTIPSRIDGRFKTVRAGTGDRIASALRADIRLYLDVPLDEIADAFLPIFDATWSWLGRDRFNWWRNEGMSMFAPLRRCTPTTLDQVLRRGAPRDIGLFEAKGVAAPAADANGALDVAEVSIMARWHTRDGAHFATAAPGELRALDRWERLFEQPDEWRAQVLRICDSVPVRSGVAGIVAEQSGLTGPSMSTLYGAAMRHVGIDLNNDWSLSMGHPHAIKGVGWLTIIGREAWSRVAGDPEARRRLDPTVQVHETKHAVVLQAGPLPAAGDVNRGDTLPAYRSVYALLEELHQPMIEAAIPFQLGRPDDAERTEAWLRRFGTTRKT